MEDVVLHYKPGADELKSVLERTEGALESFTCRLLPVFTPWYPSGRDQWLPIRPSKPPPVITPGIENIVQNCPCADLLPEPTPTPLRHRPVTQNKTTRLSPESKQQKQAETKLPPEDKLQTHKDGLLVAGTARRRSWSVFAQKGLVAQNCQSLSKQFHKIVWKHRLHLRQRARWVICEQNCGTAGDIEQVWRELNRATRSSKLPTCNANIQRDLAQIWVFCDVLYCEHVGKYLKAELGLSGKITLSVNKLGEIFSF